MSLIQELQRRNVLRVATAYIVLAWLVIQVVETIFPAFGFGDASVRIVTLAFAAGFVPVLVIAWVFEWTPEGLKRESDIDRTASITSRTGKTLDRFIILFLALALGYFAFDKFVLSESREASIAESARQEGRSEALVESFGDQSIAVLPFVNMSDDASNEYFSDGISEELLNLLAKIPELRVISRSSAFAFKGEKIDIPEIAQRLNVAHVLEGSVRKAGNQVRVTAQLIDARSDTHLWSETYDRTLDNIFAIQDEIAGMVVSQLRIELLGAAPVTVETYPAAYALFLRARYQRRQNSADSLAQAEQLLTQVLETDPFYLPAMDDLITVYINQAHTGEKSYAEGYELARELTLKGLEADPNNGRMYTQMAWIKAYFDGDLQAGAEMFERALALSPNDTSLLGDTASFLSSLGRIDESLALNEFVLARDPVHPVARANYAFTLMAAGRLDESIEQFRLALGLSPDYGGARYALAVALLLQGKPEQALIEIQQESSEVFHLTGEAMVHHVLGGREAAGRALNALVNQYTQGWSFNIALVYAFRGEADAAFQWLEKSIETGSPDLAEINTNILLKPLYADPRWQQILTGMGKAPEQLAAIRFSIPVALP